MWGLAATNTVYGCGASDRDHAQLLTETFAHLRSAGVTVVRFWAFQSYATDAAHARNWTALDRVFASAEAQGIALIPVLGNNWTDCDYWPISAYPNGGQRKDATNWYLDGYRTPYDGYLVDYTTWVREITGRYGARRSLLAWELVNEPQARSYTDADVAALASFLKHARDVAKAAGATAPISFGNMGTGQPGFDNARYAEMVREADLGTAHDYGYDNEPLPREGGCRENCIRTALSDTLAAGKRFYIGEAGIDACDTSLRASQLTAKIDAAFRAGASGYILWAYDERATRGQCGFDFGPGSVLMDAIAGYRHP